MKNIIFILLVGFVFLFIGCQTTKSVVEQPKQPSQSIQAEKPAIFKQLYYPKLAVGDPLQFFNSSDIILAGSSSDQTILLQGGAIHIVDSILTITKTVFALTPGIVKVIKKSSDGKIQTIIVLFSLGDRTYELSFQLKSDGSFTLNANAKLFFRDKEYKILASTRGGECLLLVNISMEKSEENINEKAEGVNVSGN